MSYCSLRENIIIWLASCSSLLNICNVDSTFPLVNCIKMIMMTIITIIYRTSQEARHYTKSSHNILQCLSCSSTKNWGQIFLKMCSIRSGDCSRRKMIIIKGNIVETGPRAGDLVTFNVSIWQLHLDASQLFWPYCP